MSERGDQPGGAPGTDADGPRVMLFTVESERFAVISLPLAPPNGLSVLTAAERDVCRRVYLGASNTAIAEARGTSERTVANQVASIFRKLGIHSRVELIALGLKE